MTVNILIPTQYFSDSRLGGEARIVWDISNALARLGAKVYVVTAHLDQLKNKPNVNIRVYVVPFCKEVTNLDPVTMTKLYLFSLPLILVKRIHVVYSPVIFLNSLFSRFRFGKVLVETEDETWDYSVPQFAHELAKDRKLKFEEAGIAVQKRSILERVFMRGVVLAYRFFALNKKHVAGVDGVICRTENAAREIQEVFPHVRFIVLPYGVDTREFRPDGPRVERDADKTIFLFAGVISYRKGIFYVAEAFRHLVKEHPSAALWVVGGGAPETEICLREFLHGVPNVTLFGRVPFRDVHRYYVSADVYINVALVSQQCPIEVSVMEAMACGIPVLVHRTPMYTEVAQETGILLADMQDVDGIYQAMKTYFLMPELRETIGGSMRQYTLDHLDLDVVAVNTIAFFTELLKKR